jgi:putative SOS response-associated peptidase YedK
LADGFYEWDKKSIKHIPYRIMLEDSKPFAFAGICDYWKDEKDNEIRSFSIITTQANELIAKIHDRMPVILSPDKEKKWLDPKLDINEAKEYLKSYPAERMNMYEIATLINSPKNDMEEVLRPI